MDVLRRYVCIKLDDRVWVPHYLRIEMDSLGRLCDTVYSARTSEQRTTNILYVEDQRAASNIYAIKDATDHKGYTVGSKEMRRAANGKSGS